MGSSPGARPEYEVLVRKMATTIAQRNMTLVYGGGNVGLMGVAADSALAAGGKVIGVIPADIADKEVGHLGRESAHLMSQSFRSELQARM